MDLIRCPQCGEQYSSSYPRCPFCEEEDNSGSRRLKYRPKRHIADQRKAQSARGGLIVVLIAVLALLSWYLFGDNIAPGGKTDEPGNTPPAENGQPSVPANNPNASDPFFEDPNVGDEPSGGGEPSGAGEGDPDVLPQPPVNENIDVSGAKLNREDFTLGYEGEKFTIRLSGTEAAPTWSIDNPNVATIAADGTVTAVANGDTTVHCKVGSRDLACTVRVRNTGKTAAAAGAPMVAEPIVPTEPAAPGSTTPNTQTPGTQTPSTPAPSATHVDADSLSVKTNYGTTLKKDPGTGYPDCTVRIGGDPISLSIVGTDVPVSSWTSDKTSVVEVSSDGHLTPVSAGTAHVTAKVGDAAVTCIIRVR